MSRHAPLRLVAYTPTESSQNPSLSQIYQDLELVKRMGFDGIKLWDTNQLQEKGWLGPVLSDAESLDLRVNVVYQFNQTTDIFPPSQNAIDAMKLTIEKLAAVTKTSKAVAWNSLFASFDWNKTKAEQLSIVTSQTYRDGLNDLLGAMESEDPQHQARISLDFDPRIGFPILSNAQGYGIMPYSLIQDGIDSERVLAFVAYFASTGKPVYIDEWGLHTSGGQEYGYATSEKEKGKLLVDFARLARAHGLDWTYFMLLDRIPTISFETGNDWGLLNLDRTPRPSAVAVSDAFQGALI